MRNFIILILLLINSLAYGQINPGFETNSVVDCRNCCLETTHPFGEGKVHGWQASHGTPQINKSNASCLGAEADVNLGTQAAYLSFSSTNKEGIFQEMTIKKDESFSFAVFVKGGNAKVVLKLANGLVNENPAISVNGSGNPNIPNPTSQQLLIEHTITGSSWQRVIVDEIIASADYSQIWIYALDGDVFVDDFSFHKSCCEPNKVYQNITNPPSTYVNNYIVAGENVDTSQPTGKVVITANTEVIKFEAGQSIELRAGFETEVGAKFSAEIKDCGKKEFVISMTEVDAWVNSGSIEKACFKAFQGSACFGSGHYKYSWDNGYGVNRSRAGYPNFSANIDLNSPQWLFVTVIDTIKNDTLRKGIYIPATPFSGDFSIDLFNIITPNGDSINDLWFAIDSSRLNEDSFGYNAYDYKLWIYNRWGAELHYAAGTNKTKGFAFDEINWIEDYCNITSSGALFGILKLSNCSKSEEISFSITLVCGSTEPYNLNLDNSDSVDFNVIVFPNPSSFAFVVESAKVNIENIYLIDLKGKRLSVNKNQYSPNQVKVDLRNLASGNYIVEIHLSNASTVYKRILIE